MLSQQFKVRSANDPMHVVLSRQGNSWDEEIQKGKDETEMIARLMSTDAISHETKEKTYDDKWDKRKMPGRKPKPRYTEHGTIPPVVLPGQAHRPVHVPIIMQEGEFVRFQDCSATARYFWRGRGRKS